MRNFLRLGLVCWPLFAFSESTVKDDAPAVAPAKAAAPVTEEAPSPPAEAAAPGEESWDNLNFRLIEVFNVEQLPGAGTLTYTVGDKSEKISLGKEMGYYALGVIFDGRKFPDQYSKDLKKNQIIQVAMGSLKSRLQGQIPQFGVLSVISDGVPTVRTRYPFFQPEPGKKAPDESAFLLFMSPATPADRNDEEKLKGTYFSQSGRIVVTPQGLSQTLEFKSQGRRFKFRMQRMKMEFDVKLTTPFNAQPAALAGSIDFPVYSPKGKEADKLVQRLASDSLSSTATQALEEGLSAHKREVAGSKKKK